MKNIRSTWALSFLALSFLFMAAATNAANENASEKAKSIFEYWTPERRASAIPRDLYLDEKGQGYIRNKNNTLTPYGGKFNLSALKPMAKPDGAGTGGKGGGKGDGGTGSNGSLNTLVTYLTPSESQNTVTSLPTVFTASIADPEGVKSVSFMFRPAQSSGSEQRFSPSCVNSGTEVICDLQIATISEGAWEWWVTGKDGSPKGGLSYNSSPLTFNVDTSTNSSSCGGSIISESEWSCDGNVQSAAGRILFSMPGGNYVCSGTVINDWATSGRSIILTAAHCVYDDENKVFASNVLFIPDQANTSGAGTDTNCSNDPLGCWVASFGVVDPDYTSRVFPDNSPWDYAYYVVADDDVSHAAGYNNPSNSTLDSAAGYMNISFTSPTQSKYTYALGYSYAMDPSFRYCAEGMSTNGSSNWWLGNCGLTGGSSGGPWSQSDADDLGNGPVISVNSWGYIRSSGMAGPKLSNNTAQCLFDVARSAPIDSSGIVGCN